MWIFEILTCLHRKKNCQRKKSFKHRKKPLHLPRTICQHKPRYSKKDKREQEHSDATPSTKESPQWLFINAFPPEFRNDDFVAQSGNTIPSYFSRKRFALTFTSSTKFTY
ncbi:hypothetical protein CDAR_474121 [Caerostris darwini]|uniref:Uncharacterized protein n=1 Tax=Caerostris darwini TaxID=1538125 RepID=A0AAV4SH71_9ARAC|nr:hypothetical protein CDAR_474121 [Caerostris darwini]